MADKCIRCGFNTNKTCQTYREQRRLIGNTYEWHRNYLRISGVEDVEEQSVVCGNCRTKLNKERDIAVTDDPAEREKRKRKPIYWAVKKVDL